MKAVLPSSRLWLLFPPARGTRGRDPSLSNQQALYFPRRYSNKTSLHIALFLITPVSLGDNNQTERGILQTDASISLSFSLNRLQLLRGAISAFPLWPIGRNGRRVKTQTSERLTAHESEPRLGTHH